MSHYDQLRNLVSQLTDCSSRKERNALAAEIHDLLGKIENAAPLATSEEALDRAYEQGAFKAMEIAKGVRAQKEAPIRNAEIGAGYPVLNGLMHYGQDLLGSADQAVMAHLLERKRGRR